jgi:sulfite exporter TauE/SafE
MISQLTEGFLLGIATGTTCLATCGPVYAPYLMQYERNIWKSLLALLEISAGRFIAYSLVGVISGFLGSSLENLNRDLFTASAYILFSVFLLITTFRTSKKEKCCQTGKWSSFVDRPIVLGVLTGINFCPSFLLAVTKAVDISGPLSGFYLFASFFVGTSLFLIPLSFFGVFGLKKQLRFIARVSAVAIGIWFIMQACIMLYRYYDDYKSAQNIDPSLIINVLETDKPVQILATDTTGLLEMKKLFSQKVKSSVLMINDRAQLNDSGVVIATSEWVGNEHIELHSLRKPGRFLVFLPDSSNKNIPVDKINKMLTFFGNYYFKTDPDSGTVFQMPNN